MNPAQSERRGILAGGNWIVDRPKIIDVYPVQDSLANILQAGGYMVDGDLKIYEVRGDDPVTLGVAVLVLWTAGLIACLLPGFRAAKVDPMAALRQ